MPPRDGTSTYNEKSEADHGQMSTPPTPSSNSAFSCNETPTWLGSPTTEKKQCTSILRRLRTISTASSSSYSLSPSISSVAGTETCSSPGSSEWSRGPISPPYNAPDNAAKTILSWGNRLLRRHGSMLALSSLILKEESERSSIEVSETCQRPQHCPTKSKHLGKDLKKAISPPYDFHHVTHTQPRHFESLDRGSQNELITEFIAIRASQRPKSTLQGIHADDVRNGNDATQLHTRKHPYASEKENSLGSPGRLPNDLLSTRTSPTSSRPNRSIPSSPSIGNFSRPAPRFPILPRSPPPRTSSRHALECPSHPTKLKSTSGQGTAGQPTSDLQADTQRSPNSDFDGNDSHVWMPHAITTVEAAGVPLETWPLPAASPDSGSAHTPSAGTGPEHQAKGALSRSTSLPLRHAQSFPTTKILSQHDHNNNSNHREEAMQIRPESLQSKGQWEDDVDYCYDNAVQADSNFDWSQKTVYVDDLDSTDASVASDHQSEGRISLEAEQLQCSGKVELRPRPGALGPPRFSAPLHPPPQHKPKKSVTELEERLSPFGRHQSTSEFRGYQHLTQASSKPTPKLHIASDDISGDEEAFFDGEACDYVELGTLTEHCAASNRCHSGGSSSFRAARPLLNKYRSDGSILSSTASTIRTYRSSNSISSVPDLISSPNSSRESVTVEKMSPTESINSGSHQTSERAAPASQYQTELRRLTAELPPLPCFPQAPLPRDAAGKVPLTTPTAHGQLAQTPQEAVDKQKKVDTHRVRGQSVSRKRSASAVIPGHHLAPRGSYSLFPSAHSTARAI